MSLNYLSDHFHIKGTDIEDFYRISEEVELNTSIEKINFSECAVLSYMREDQNSIYYKKFDPKNIWYRDGNDTLVLKNNVYIKKSTIHKKVKFIMEEELNSPSKLQIVHENKLIFISSSAYKTLGSKIGLNASFLSDACIERDLAIAKQFYNGDKELSLFSVVRKKDDIKKIFSVFSKSPNRIGLDTIKQLLEQRNDLECRFWSVEQQKTLIHLALKEPFKDKIHPGLLITLSDTGFYSNQIKLVWHKNNFQLGEFLEDITVDLSLLNKKTIVEDLSKTFDSLIKKSEVFHKKFEERKSIRIKKDIRNLSVLSKVLKNLGFLSSLGKSDFQVMLQWIFVHTRGVETVSDFQICIFDFMSSKEYDGFEYYKKENLRKMALLQNIKKDVF